MLYYLPPLRADVSDSVGLSVSRIVQKVLKRFLQTKPCRIMDHCHVKNQLYFGVFLLKMADWQSFLVSATIYDR